MLISFFRDINFTTVCSTKFSILSLSVIVDVCRNMGEELADEGDHVGALAAIAQTKIISQVRDSLFLFLVSFLLSSSLLSSFSLLLCSSLHLSPSLPPLPPLCLLSFPLSSFSCLLTLTPPCCHFPSTDCQEECH